MSEPDPLPIGGGPEPTNKYTYGIDASTIGIFNRTVFYSGNSWPPPFQFISQGLNPAVQAGAMSVSQGPPVNPEWGGWPEAPGVPPTYTLSGYTSQAYVMIWDAGRVIEAFAEQFVDGIDLTINYQGLSPSPPAPAGFLFGIPEGQTLPAVNPVGTSPDVYSNNTLYGLCWVGGSYDELPYPGTDPEILEAYNQKIIDATTEFADQFATVDLVGVFGTDIGGPFGSPPPDFTAKVDALTIPLVGYKEWIYDNDWFGIIIKCISEPDVFWAWGDALFVDGNDPPVFPTYVGRNWIAFASQTTWILPHPIFDIWVPLVEVVAPDEEDDGDIIEDRPIAGRATIGDRAGMFLTATGRAVVDPIRDNLYHTTTRRRMNRGL